MSWEKELRACKSRLRAIKAQEKEIEKEYAANAESNGERVS